MLVQYQLFLGTKKKDGISYNIPGPMGAYPCPLPSLQSQHWGQGLQGSGLQQGAASQEFPLFRGQGEVWSIMSAAEFLNTGYVGTHVHSKNFKVGSNLGF